MTDYFAHIRGQETVARLLNQALAQNRLSHAYLFLGPPGVGKTAVAEALIRAVFALETFSLQDQLPDVKVVALKEGEKSIGKNAISKEVIPWLGIRPYHEGKKVVVIAGAHTMTLEAANALLKILEEPPEYALIILVADQLELLATIVSRCQQLRFSALEYTQVADILTARGVEPDEARLRAVLSRGNTGLAAELPREEMETVWAAAIAVIKNFHQADRAAVFSVAAQLEKQPLLATVLMVLLRDIYVYQQTGEAGQLIVPGQMEQLPGIKLAAGFYSAWQELQDLNRYQTGNVNKLMLNVHISYKLYHMLAG
jgi:DNA polymerase-3 subunit delta'